MKVSIGKNTLGGGKKMTTRLNNYNRSTHDLSNVIRTSMAPGVLVPTLKHLVLPGDTFPIQTRCHTLTHPTIGPLFGSFKQQNDFFFCPIRLYNSMLHNNALNIGLDMKKVKFPVILVDTKEFDQTSSIPGSGGTLKNQVHPSSLPAYLGYKALNINRNEQGYATIQGLPLLMYFDIFKNYYANKQEKSFYTIAGDQFLPFAGVVSVPNSFTTARLYLTNNGKIATIDGIFSSSGTTTMPETDHADYVGIVINPLSNSSLPDDYSLEVDMNIKSQIGSGWLTHNIKFTGTIRELIENGTIKEASLSNLPTGGKLYYIPQSLMQPNYTFQMEMKQSWRVWQSELRYKKYDLEAIDVCREDILAAGRSLYEIKDSFIADIFKLVNQDNEGSLTFRKPACANPMVGLALKTYQSDINTNWVNTEWIEGDTGINAITAIDTSSGSFTLDTLNLAKKVYTMLNRIAVSDGSYNAWIQTVYTSGGLNHIETPLYLGGSSLEIEFQEVINNSGTEDQPLGTLAGRGTATNHKGGNIIFKADEPGYIFCITSITPRVDYFQGNDWDLYLNTMDDLHKPQLDGIGFQDRLYKYINGNATNSELDKSIGKQPAWIEYMTNVNKTYGNFALIENEGWMCLNRIFGDPDTYTTYIQPHLYNNIFADTEFTSQNFWVQIAFNTQPRRVMSAKVIPNI